MKFAILATTALIASVSAARLSCEPIKPVDNHQPQEKEESRKEEPKRLFDENGNELFPAKLVTPVLTDGKGAVIGNM